MSDRLIEESRQWLRDNEDGMFNICCQRCNAPFEHEGQSVAAPPEWYGLLDENTRLGDRLESALETLAAYQTQHDLSDSARHCLCSYCNRARNLLAVSPADTTEGTG